jgi:molecular chaperone DnaK
MVNEAEAHADDDLRRREEIEVKNHSDNLAYSIEKTLGEVGDKLPAELKSEVEGKIAALRSALTSGTVDQIRSAKDELEAAAQRIGEMVYSQASAGADAGSGCGDGSCQDGGCADGSCQDDGAVEGEFREV